MEIKTGKNGINDLRRKYFWSETRICGDQKFSDRFRFPNWEQKTFQARMSATIGLHHTWQHQTLLKDHSVQQSDPVIFLIDLSDSVTSASCNTR